MFRQTCGSNSNISYTLLYVNCGNGRAYLIWSWQGVDGFCRVVVEYLFDFEERSSWRWVGPKARSQLSQSQSSSKGVVQFGLIDLAELMSLMAPWKLFAKFCEIAAQNIQTESKQHWSGGLEHTRFSLMLNKHWKDRKKAVVETHNTA